MTRAWETVIGLEVHAQVTSCSKLFSGAPTAFGAPPNTQVSLVDAAFPGMLPVLNRFCVDQAIRTGLGLHADIALVSVFERKNYFYPDLPAGYQISQYQHPIVKEGWLEIEGVSGETRCIGIERLHLEQDAGKSVHDLDPTITCIDLNRAGIALMEIVTKPDLRNAEETMTFLKLLRQLLRYLGTCDGNMEEGSLRADVNISLRQPGAPLGTRVEVKNVNSIRFVAQAIAFEAQRQAALLESGGEVEQETRLFDAHTGETRSMRSKEDAQDYRYFPDPDLLPLRLTEEHVAQIRAGLPELPDAKKRRLMQDFGLSSYDADLLVAEPEFADYYERVLQALQGESGQKISTHEAKIAANWMLGDFSAHLNRMHCSVSTTPIAPARLAGLVRLVLQEVISGKIAKDLFTALETEEGEPEAIVSRRGWAQVVDSGEIDRVIRKVLAEEEGQVAAYKSGKDKLFGYFVGQVMKASAGKANPKLVNERLKSLLEAE
ncbi:MAG: Asp-tRNA(Asn)/Glu-tRNA(Gln) amidotransferase subunit GatB [Holosporales bacterium]|jgi:aspartyl-tRNA(Asn)/glutamyl-tRNA(Gln) amidotransferase subunit B|nr:Asp-tRNA(Asn)/Glu-tRNA(Gln) amidotransferase subunit GatB [Holosporales bacterium]